MDSLPAKPQGKRKNTGVGSLLLPQQIFPTQESNPGLLHCRQILYQLGHQIETKSFPEGCPAGTCRWGLLRSRLHLQRPWNPSGGREGRKMGLTEKLSCEWWLPHGGSKAGVMWSSCSHLGQGWGALYSYIDRLDVATPGRGITLASQLPATNACWGQLSTALQVTRKISPSIINRGLGSDHFTKKPVWTTRTCDLLSHKMTLESQSTW